jgi:hypothetical protein
MGEFFNAILRPLEYVVAWIMVAFHRALSAIGLPEASGWTWGLSIVGLVVVIRILLIPLFVKQITASRGMQLIQPEMKKIQEKYKGKTDQASRPLTAETGAVQADGHQPVCLLFAALAAVADLLCPLQSVERDSESPGRRILEQGAR